MSKVEIIGPRELLDDVLSFLMERESIQIEKEQLALLKESRIISGQDEIEEKNDSAETIYLEESKKKIEELLVIIPASPSRERYFNPAHLLKTLDHLLERHLNDCTENDREKARLKIELSDLKSGLLTLETIQTMVAESSIPDNLEYIGLILKDENFKNELIAELEGITAGSYELMTQIAKDGSLIGLVLIEKRYSTAVRRTLSGGHLPELQFPEKTSRMKLPEKIAWLKERQLKVENRLHEIDNWFQEFSHRWRSVYQKFHDWASERLTILKAHFSIYHSRMCFFIFGWMDSKRVESLRQQLSQKYDGKVVIEEFEVRVEELDRVPVQLRNPPFIKPFEIFIRFLPLPVYSSYDPTPFIATFFPIFFGIILGDAGYGILIMLISLSLLWRFKHHPLVSDAAKVFIICSVYAVIFGVLYGEYFGELGHHHLGLKPIWLDRHLEIIPMLGFAVSLGLVHVLFGILLSIKSEWRKGAKKEVFVRVINIILIVTIGLIVAALAGYSPPESVGPLTMMAAALVPVLVLAGGLLAPLELLKSIGNIVSYARIMAIGLSSVLLAYVANKLAGLSGNLLLGALVGGLLHLLNIVLGTFSPTIHSLRLHYVEFFGKFLDQGGKSFKPFSKKS